MSHGGLFPHDNEKPPASYGERFGATIVWGGTPVWGPTPL